MCVLSVVKITKIWMAVHSLLYIHITDQSVVRTSTSQVSFKQVHHSFVKTLIINANEWLCPYRYSFWEVVNDLQILNWSARSFAHAVFYEFLQGFFPFYISSHLLGISGIWWYINTVVCILWYSFVLYEVHKCKGELQCSLIMVFIKESCPETLTTRCLMMSTSIP